MIIRIVPFLFFFICFKVQSQEQWSLQRCVAYAMENNLTVKQAVYQAQSSRLTAKQTKTTLLPTVNGSIQGAYQRGLNENPTTGTLESANFFSGSIGAQTSYTIFNWGARKNNIASTELFAKADEVGIEKAKNDIALFVANQFLQVMLRREQVRISDAAVQLSRAQMVNAQKLVDAGSQPELNVIQIDAQLERDSALLLQAQSLVEEGLINLKTTLNIDLATPFDIAAPALDDILVEKITDLQPEYVYNIAVRTQPVQRQYALRIEATKRQVQAARGSMYPTVSAFGGLNSRFINAKAPVLLGLQTAQPTGAYIVDNSGNKTNVLSDRPLFGTKGVGLFNQLNKNFGQSLGLSLNFPVFNNWSSRTQWERAKLNVLTTKLQDDQERLTLKSNIYTAYQQAFSSLQKYNASIRSVTASQRALDISKKRYDIGLLGTLDYIITQNNLYRAQIEEVSNRYDYIFKMKVLEFYKGNGIKL